MATILQRLVRTRWALASLPLAGLLMLASCGGSPAPSPSATPTQAGGLSIAAAGQALKSGLSPLEGALARFTAQAEASGAASTQASLQADAVPVLAALDAFQGQLTSTNWPSSMVNQINPLVLDVNGLRVDLKGLSGPAPTGPDSTFAHDMNVFIQHADTLLTALGMPV